MEGPFKGQAPTSELIEFYGMAIFEVILSSTRSSKYSVLLSPVMELILVLLQQLDEHSKIVKVEFFYDRGELLGGLLNGAVSDGLPVAAPSDCPVLRSTG